MKTLITCTSKIDSENLKLQKLAFPKQFIFFIWPTRPLPLDSIRKIEERATKWAIERLSGTTFDPFRRGWRKRDSGPRKLVHKRYFFIIRAISFLYRCLDPFRPLAIERGSNLLQDELLRAPRERLLTPSAYPRDLTIEPRATFRPSAAWSINWMRLLLSRNQLLEHQWCCFDPHTASNDVCGSFSAVNLQSWNRVDGPKKAEGVPPWSTGLI